MAGNSFGHTFRISTFGESHGPAIGVVIDGCPAGVTIDMATIQGRLDRRRPGQGAMTTARAEADRVQVLSGLFEGVTTGTPITLVIYNQDAQSKDYAPIANVYRPGHADYTYDAKYGIRDYRGGGRSSARETAARVAAAAIAEQYLKQAIGADLEVLAYVSSVGQWQILNDPRTWTSADVQANDLRCPDLALAKQMQEVVRQAKEVGDSLGGVVSCSIRNCPVGLGEPVFDKLPALLGHAMLSINAAKGFEIGSGFEGTQSFGSEHNDSFQNDAGNITTRTNHSGGVLGGISNGMEIYFRVAFKPVSSIKQSQQSIDKAGEAVTLNIEGRHDPLVLPRAVPIVEAMAWLVLAELYLRTKTDRL